MSESEHQPLINQQIETIYPQGTSGSERQITPQDSLTTSNTDPPPEEKNHSCTCRPDQTPLPKQWMEGLALFVGICAVLIYGWQLWVMKKQLIDNEKATRLITQTQIKMKMPLIVPELSEINWNNTPGEPPSIWVVQNFRNIGETRAIGANIKFGWGRQLPDLHTPFQGTYNSAESWIWMPNYANKQRVIMPINKAREWAREVNDFKKPLYVYGQIRYNDVFPHDDDFGLRSDHLAEFCTQIISIDIGEKTKGKTTRWGGKPCPIPQPTCADEDCPKADYYHYEPQR